MSQQNNTEDKVGKIKTYTIIALFAVIGLLLLFKQCGTPSTVYHYTKGEDSVVYDTVKIPYEIVKFKGSKPKHDTLYRVDSVFDFSLCQYIREYKDTVSNDSIDIFTFNRTIGSLDSTQVSYAWKLPRIDKTIYRTDTLSKTVPNKWALYIGGEVGGNKTSFNISPYAGIRIKNVSYQYRYGIVDRTHNIGVGYKIFTSKK